MTTVELFKDIGLYMSMKKTIDFASKATQNTWFSSKVSKTVSNVAFNKLQNLLHIPMDYGEALEYTYVRFKSLDSSGRVYYYFIHSATLIDDTTVAFQLVLDPIQTFMCEWEIGECMVNRKHCDRWNKTSSLPIWDKPNIEGIITNYISNFKTELVDEIAYEVSGKTYYISLATIALIYKTSDSLKIGYAVIGMAKDTTIPISITVKYVYSRMGYQSYEITFPKLTEFSNNTVYTSMGIDPESALACAVIPFNIINGTTSFDATTLKLTITGETSFSSEPVYIGTLDCGMICEYSLYGITQSKTYEMGFSRPSKPSNGIEASSVYEPAMYKEPYIKRSIINGSGTFNMDVPDLIINKSDNDITFTAMFGTSSQLIKANILDSDYDVAKEEGMAISQMADTIDVFTNAWLTYTLTQRDSDRNILNNTLNQQAISNLLFMGYGGALVGSRGGGEGYVKGLGAATLPAVALASGASLVGSAVNNHYAWENQKEEERKIQNQAQRISISGTNGAVNILKQDAYISAIEMKCDDVNYNQAYNNYRYYGYEINEWQKPNIKSRKYFDYILTNGAVIDGALNQNIKEQIANIFDNGITIFHGDYTTTLDYPTYENIERSLL